ncbi:hypothetical protein RDWZM_005348 [Blomia tropicalis]|uniref:Uncharacterized protein n=1 Tax=Blomia tropicalis TaxID=40697 RepID=A0A9Q0RND5_BLOTA|nr:hypothetical protein RDWZM_005348 [Blomia tropicalis]
MLLRAHLGLIIVLFGTTVQANYGTYQQNFQNLVPITSPGSYPSSAYDENTMNVNIDATVQQTVQPTTTSTSAAATTEAAAATAAAAASIPTLATHTTHSVEATDASNDDYDQTADSTGDSYDEQSVAPVAEPLATPEPVATSSVPALPAVPMGPLAYPYILPYAHSIPYHSAPYAPYPMDTPYQTGEYYPQLEGKYHPFSHYQPYVARPIPPMPYPMPHYPAHHHGAPHYGQHSYHHHGYQAHKPHIPGKFEKTVSLDKSFPFSIPNLNLGGLLQTIENIAVPALNMEMPEKFIHNGDGVDKFKSHESLPKPSLTKPFKLPIWSGDFTLLHTLSKIKMPEFGSISLGGLGELLGKFTKLEMAKRDSVKPNPIGPIGHFASPRKIVTAYPLHKKGYSGHVVIEDFPYGRPQMGPYDEGSVPSLDCAQLDGKLPLGSKPAHY